MITGISPVNRYNTQTFGMARLNQEGREGAKSCGYQKHEFLDQKMFKRPGIFAEKSRLAEKLEKHANFVTLCEQYGCTKDGLNNANFINNQIFHQKSKQALENIPKDTYKDGMLKLYYTNFDNPNLSVDATSALLETVKDFISLDEYFSASGILQSGTVNS